MKKLSEHRIEQFIRFPEELSEKELNEVRSLIETSDEAREIYMFLKDFYNEFDQLNKPEVFVIPLKQKSFKKDHSGPAVLAAMTPKTKSASLVTKTTLVSEEHKMVVRVLENQIDHSLQVHVVGASKAQSEHAILSILNTGIDLVTNAHGKLKGVRELSDFSWENAATVLRIPKHKVSIDPLKPTSPASLKSILNFEAQIEISDDRLKIEFLEEKPSLNRLLLVQGKNTELLKIDDQKVELTIKTKELLTLYFYE